MDDDDEIYRMTIFLSKNSLSKMYIEFFSTIFHGQNESILNNHTLIQYRGNFEQLSSFLLRGSHPRPNKSQSAN